MHWHCAFRLYVLIAYYLIYFLIDILAYESMLSGSWVLTVLVLLHCPEWRHGVCELPWGVAPPVHKASSTLSESYADLVTFILQLTIWRTVLLTSVKQRRCGQYLT